MPLPPGSPLEFILELCPPFSCVAYTFSWHSQHPALCHWVSLEHIQGEAWLSLGKKHPMEIGGNIIFLANQNQNPVQGQALSLGEMSIPTPQDPRTFCPEYPNLFTYLNDKNWESYRCRMPQHEPWKQVQEKEIPSVY